MSMSILKPKYEIKCWTAPLQSMCERSGKVKVWVLTFKVNVRVSWHLCSFYLQLPSLQGTIAAVNFTCTIHTSISHLLWHFYHILHWCKHKISWAGTNIQQEDSSRRKMIWSNVVYIFCVWEERAEQSLLHSWPRNLFTRDKQEDAGESLPSSTLNWIPAKNWMENKKSNRQMQIQIQINRRILGHPSLLPP